jgi:hypothetical protein
METDATTNPTTPAAPATPTATATPAPQFDVQRAAEIKKLERERVNGIRSAGLTLRRPETEIQTAIDNDTPLDAYRAAAIDALGKAPPSEGGPLSFERSDPRITPGADQRDKFIQRSENWLLQRSGQSGLVAEAAKKAGKTVDLDPGESRGLSLVEVARECLERVGVRTRGMDLMQLVGLAFTHRGAGMNSTSDFAVILENTLNKTLLAAYATTPDTWRRWCITGTLTDFRQHNRYRQGSIGVLPTVLEGGEFTNIVVPGRREADDHCGHQGRHHRDHAPDDRQRRHGRADRSVLALWSLDRPDDRGGRVRRAPLERRQRPDDERRQPVCSTRPTATSAPAARRSPSRRSRPIAC